jgi:uncharacterized protein (TIGR03435 family)
MQRRLCAFLMLSLACGTVWGQSAGKAGEFEVASIKPSRTPPGRGLASLREDIKSEPARLTMDNISLNTGIRWAYKLGVYEISGPDWISDQRYDIAAKAAAEVSEDQLRLMLRSLLADRFKLAAHRETKDVSGYALVAGKKPKLTAVEGGVGGEGSMTGAALMFEGHKMPLSRLADILASALKTPVRDMTGLEGNYDFKLDLRPDLLNRQPGDGPLDLAGIAITALDEQLGLRLEARKLPIEILIVDHAEKAPSEN